MHICVKKSNEINKIHINIYALLLSYLVLSNCVNFSYSKHIYFYMRE